MIRKKLIPKILELSLNIHGLSQKKLENLVSINLGFRFNKIITLRVYTDYCTNNRITTLYWKFLK